MSYLPLILIISLGSVAVILFIVRLWLNSLERNMKVSGELVEWMKELGTRVENSTQSVDEKLAKNMAMFNNRLDNAANVIGQVQKSIGEFSEIGRSMQELQQFISSPKLRGNLGEQILKELLAQHFPSDSYVLQHGFKNGERVDAIIKTTQGFIPIDSKFPVDNFKKFMKEAKPEEKDKFKKLFESDVKKHIQDIAKKYILVSEGTVDYALIYIPAESVFYEIICNEDLMEFAGQKRVLPVSPMSFYAYMKAILMSFEGQRIQSQAKEILKVLQAIRKDYEKTEEAIGVLNKHITNAYNQTSQVSKVFVPLGQKLSSTRLIPQKNEDYTQADN